ncbi:hypothetical protein [Streptosporangium subroseum]|uniref:hypothetical protein n=1 Tax=Streptosporangium subroseum TaxID=106412 RepID=UPI00308654F7|nr:hypothetical protein OHB15_43305 [Streptosporangium subroseum]
MPDETGEAPFSGFSFSYGDLLLGFTYEALRAVIILGALLLSALLIAAVLVAVFYHVPRRLLGLRRKPRLRGDREEQGAALEWLR